MHNSDQSRTLTLNGSFNRLTLVCCLIVAFTATGCSKAYNAERLFWKAQQISIQIAKDPFKATPEQYSKAIKAFENVIQKAPGSQAALRSQLAIGSLHAIRADYPKAREAYNQVLENSTSAEFSLSARLSIARTYEVEKKWDDAVKTYKEISDYHPWTKIGMESLLYVGALYRRLGKEELAAKAYERAVKRYSKLIADAPAPEMTIPVKGYLAGAYQRLGQWEPTIKTLLELESSKVQGVNRPLVLLTLGSIYQTKVKDPKKAVKVYRKLADEFPKHPFAKVARAQIKHISSSAERKAAVPPVPVMSGGVSNKSAAAPAVPR